MTVFAAKKAILWPYKKKSAMYYAWQSHYSEIPSLSDIGVHWGLE